MKDHKVFDVIYGEEAARIEREQPERIMGCRYVRDWRRAEEHEPGKTVWFDGKLWRPKSRLAVQGHQDPDLNEKAESGRLTSPTVQQQTIQVGLQTAATKDMDVEIVDIKVAFLNSYEYGPDVNPVYCRPPPNTPGLPEGALLRVRKPSYRFNDAPEQWRQRLDSELKKLDLTPLRMDACAYKFCEEIQGEMVVSVA